MYLFMTRCVHFQTFIPINRYDLPVHGSTVLHVHRCTCSVCFFFFGVTCTMTFQLIYWGTYTQIHQKIYLPVYLHAFLSSHHKDLPVTTTTCVHAPRCTRSWLYLFMFILSFWWTVRSTRQRFYCSTCTQIHLFISIPVQLISSFSA